MELTSPTLINPDSGATSGLTEHVRPIRQPEDTSGLLKREKKSNQTAHQASLCLTGSSPASRASLHIKVRRADERQLKDCFLQLLRLLESIPDKHKRTLADN